MKCYFRYANYLFKHKLFVTLECFKHGLIWRGLVHDWDKFLPNMFIQYAKHFYSNERPKRDSTGYYKPYETDNEKFDLAWLKHTKRNKHHWQWWTLSADGDESESLILYDIPKKYIVEMLCDWRGAAKAQKNTHTTKEWYNKNKHRLVFSENTQKFLEELLETF
jgi:hypothetical protein